MIKSLYQSQRHERWNISPKGASQSSKDSKWIQRFNLWNDKYHIFQRLLATDKETNALVLKEISILKQLSGHAHILQYLAAAAVEMRGGGGTEYLLLTELCPRSLVECLGTTALPPDVVARIFWQACKAVHHMHSQVPPVIHRDLKVLPQSQCAEVIFRKTLVR